MTIIKIKDLDLMELSIRWEDGDKFALIEAVAYCAAKGREYPDWVRARIDEAMTSVFEAVFPNTDFKNKPSPAVLPPDTSGTVEREQLDRFKKAAAKAAKDLCLTVDRDNPLQIRKRVVRDYALAYLIAECSTFRPTPDPKFSGVEKSKSDLVNALNISPVEWAKLAKSKAPLPQQVNNKNVRACDIPQECRMATSDIIRRAWEDHRKVFIAERFEQFQSDPDNFPDT